MLEKYAEVIKKDNIIVDGSVCVTPVSDLKTEFQMLSSVPASASAKATASHVKVIESDNERVIIEVTCACGFKNQIECYF